ncbi:ankyrin repeat domain-containing protein [Legionella sp. CNM-1927-20]|uniref:ankyrin repeat domain-containing protein n=1 Tax=Legionella sp. CNM-1927-20 TaxID=3422221 RepID=UPI00403AA265
MLTSQEYRILYLKLNCFEQVLLKLDKAIQTEASETRINLNTLLEQLSQALRRNDEEKVERLYADVKSESKKLLVIMGKPSQATFIKLLLTELYNQLHYYIEKGNVEVFSDLLGIGAEFFKKQFDLNRDDPHYYTLLRHSIEKSQLEIARLLLEKKASPDSNDYVSNSPLTVAIESQKPEFVKLLIDFGANPNEGTLSEEPFLKQATKAGRLDMVEILVAGGAKIDSSAVCFAFECQQSVIGQFLFDVIKKDAKLFQGCIDEFLHRAPLALLKRFIEDQSLTPEEKLITPITPVSTWGFEVEDDQSESRKKRVTILLDALLSKVENPKERLEVLKQVVQQIMTIEYAEPIVEKEPYYAEKALFEKLAGDSKASPVNYLVNRLLESINIDLQQGRVAVGRRLLLELCPFSLQRKDYNFYLGIDFIYHVLVEVRKFYHEHKGWPDEQTVNGLIEKCFQTAYSKSEEKSSAPPGQETRRFRAMVGGATFTNFNPGLPAGGYASDAASWYLETLFIVFDSLQEIGLLSDDLDKTELQRLLEEISEYYPDVAKRMSALTDKNSRFIGFKLNMPVHLIPSILYKRGEEWIYIVMCREFLQTSSKQNQGAVEFIISEKHTAKLESILANATKKNNFKITTDASIDREITYRLLSHFLAIETLTGIPATYSTIVTQSSYKMPTCFSSNIKPLLPILLRIMVKPTITPQQWKQFSDRLTTCILAEMVKANVATDEFKEEIKNLPKKDMQPEQIAYKLLTTLLRWREINQFKPVTDNETAGKEATVKHVLKHTNQRLTLASIFFKKVLESEESGYLGKLEMK